MNFRTEIQIPKAPFEISHQNGLLMLGSCFSENIGYKFQRYRFHTAINSHGIVFNPESAAIALEDVLMSKTYTQNELIYHQGRYLSLNHHGKFNNEDYSKTLDEINETIRIHHDQLKAAKTLFVTFGSAWAYSYKETGTVVTNCHKIPQTSFEKILIEQKEIVDRWSKILVRLQSFNKELQVVFTVSPVRYWRDGVTQNTLSKSQLTIAVHTLTEGFKNAHYFPAYELVIDDLRDYRFFKEDMLHPNEQAIQYVWEKLSHWCFSEKTKLALHELEPLLRFLEHRPLHENDSSYQNQKTKKEALIQKLLFY